jgi:hypothetical protein
MARLRGQSGCGVERPTSHSVCSPERFFAVDDMRLEPGEFNVIGLLVAMINRNGNPETGFQ